MNALTKVSWMEKNFKRPESNHWGKMCNFGFLPFVEMIVGRL